MTPSHSVSSFDLGGIVGEVDFVLRAAQSTDFVLVVVGVRGCYYFVAEKNGDVFLMLSERKQNSLSENSHLVYLCCYYSYCCC